jgi:hypothetical protein
MVGSKIKVVYGTTLPISNSEMKDFNEWLADPDDDGNHPIKYRNTSYLVSGYVE